MKRKRQHKESMRDEFVEMVLKAQKESFRAAFETAVRTGTALVLVENGKTVEVKPPYRYKLVPIKSASKKQKKWRFAK